MSRSGFSLTLLLPLLAAFPAFAQKPVVTATEWVSVGNHKQELLRQINGRWWTQDNREVYPPKKSGFGYFWIIDSKPGVTEFYHHRPFDIRKSEWVHLWMKPDEVEALLGPPNRRFPMSSGRGGMWYYYAADGTALHLWFMDRDELGEAKYLLRGGGEKPVASIERELNGQSIFHLSAQRAGKIAEQEQAKRVADMRSFGRGAQPRMGSMPSVEVARAPGIRPPRGQAGCNKGSPGLRSTRRRTGGRPQPPRRTEFPRRHLRRRRTQGDLHLPPGRRYPRRHSPPQRQGRQGAIGAVTMYKGILLSALLWFVLIAIRMRLMPPDKTKRTTQQRLKLIKVLLGALLALIAISYNLQRTNYSLEGKKDYQASWVERVVMALSN